jgi:hypothetical protein
VERLPYYYPLYSITKKHLYQEQKTKMVLLSIIFNDKTKIENIEGIYDSNNDKVVFDLNKDNKSISVFNISEIAFS